MTRPIYLDCHSTTPVAPRVLEAMLPYFSEDFGNAASRVHPFGWTAQEAVDGGRRSVAGVIGATPEEIIFTSGATESINLAVLGGLEARKAERAHIVTLRSEHKATLDACERLELSGVEVSYLDPKPDGLIDVEMLRDTVRDDTALVSILHVNNEIGVVQPLEEIGEICRAHGAWFHVDGAQSLGRADIDVEKMNIDLLSLSAHKVYGPKGVGALYVRRRPRVRPVPLLVGGGHERGLRPGTLNVPGIVGFGTAVELSKASHEEENQRITKLRDGLLSRFENELGGVHLHGTRTARAAGNMNIAIDGVEAERLILRTQRDVAFSAGSACTSRQQGPSHVLRSIGVSSVSALSSIRIGIGRFQTREDIEHAGDILISAARTLREEG